MANTEETWKRSTNHCDDTDGGGGDGFDSVVDLEESCLRKGFESGQAASKAKVARDGLALGLNKGWSIGEEVGEIKGQATFYLQLLANKENLFKEDTVKRNKLQRVLSKIITTEVAFTNPKDEAEGEALEKSLGDLRARYKQSLAILASSKQEPTAKRPAQTLDW